ncbi:hypothetical protein BDV19DRAFT_177093 [Aspergillus venezuelensis]
MARPGTTHRTRRKSDGMRNTTRKKAKTERQSSGDGNEEQNDKHENPFELIHEGLLPFDPTAISFEEIGIDTTPPNNVPPLPTHEPRETKVGVLSGKARHRKLADDSVYARVEACGRYTIVDSEDAPLDRKQYRMDPAYDTEIKLLGLVLETVEWFARILKDDCDTCRSG